MNNIQKFLQLTDDVLHQGSLGLLCNQASFDFNGRKYLFQQLDERGNLKRLFLPEHGLFAELQDQIPLDSTALYRVILHDTEIISLYGAEENSLFVSTEYVNDLDAIIIDVQDIGSRYYTFATTVSYLFDVLSRLPDPPEIYVLDRLNPCGRQVEGTILTPAYASFVGHPGLPHKHGLTIGELCRFYQSQTGGKFKLHVVPVSNNSVCLVSDLAHRSTWEIPPSPNMPGPVTPWIYTGQCLLEGTNLNEGRGTTRPFEIFGAPWLDWIFERSDYPAANGAFLRPLRYIPTFHKHSCQICNGFQLHLSGELYHSLAHSLQIVRYIKNNSATHFQWRQERYEYRDDRSAIELLTGDSLMMDYLNGQCEFGEIRQKMEIEEEQWIRDCQPYLLYPERLYRVRI